MIERSQFVYVSDWRHDDAELTVSRRGDGSATISVQQEHAVDSYNSSFTSSLTLPADAVRELANFLLGEGGTKDEPENPVKTKPENG